MKKTPVQKLADALLRASRAARRVPESILWEARSAATAAAREEVARLEARLAHLEGRIADLEAGR